LKITFLGTGTSQGIPIICCDCKVCHSKNPKDQRLRTSIYIQNEEQSILIDIGPDFRQQMLTNGFQKVDAVLLTHQHADHTAGIDDIRPIYFNQRAEIPFYGEKMVLEDLKVRFGYIFGENDYPGIPEVGLHEIYAGKEFDIGNTRILPLRIWHGQLPIIAFKIGSLAYITDAKKIDQEVIQQLYGVDCLVINALRYKEHHSHLNMEECLQIIKLINPKITYIIHLSHQMGLHSEIESTLPDQVYLAYDGLSIDGL
jgi:phosphoribosyl 1,2-cyclic phosphate phosphodiesterase